MEKFRERSRCFTVLEKESFLQNLSSKRGFFKQKWTDKILEEGELINISVSLNILPCLSEQLMRQRHFWP